MITLAKLRSRTLHSSFVLGIGKRGSYGFGGGWALLLGVTLLGGCSSSESPAVTLLEDTGRSPSDKITSKASLLLDVDKDKQVTIDISYAGQDRERDESLTWSGTISKGEIDLSETHLALPTDGKTPITVEAKYRNAVGKDEAIGSITFTYDTVVPTQLSEDSWDSPGEYNQDGYTIFVGERKGEAAKEDYSVPEDELLLQLVRITEKDGGIVGAGQVVAEQIFLRADVDRNSFIAEGEQELEEGTETPMRTYFDARFTGVLGDREGSNEFYSYQIRLVDKAGNISENNDTKDFPRPPPVALSEGGGSFPHESTFQEEVVKATSYALLVPFDEHLQVKEEDDGSFLLEGSLDGEGLIYYLLGDEFNQSEILAEGVEAQVGLGENGESDFSVVLDNWSDGDRLWIVGDVDGSRGLLVVE